MQSDRRILHELWNAVWPHKLISLCPMLCVWIGATAWQIWRSSPFLLCVQTWQWKWFWMRSQTNGAGRSSQKPFLEEISTAQMENLNKYLSVFFKNVFFYLFFSSYFPIISIFRHILCSVNVFGRLRFYAYQVYSPRKYVLSPICHLFATHLKSEVGGTLQTFRRAPAGDHLSCFHRWSRCRPHLRWVRQCRVCQKEM